MSPVKKDMKEADVVLLWQKQMQQDRSLQDISGEPVTVVYPGRRNDSRGGDFCDALVDTAGSSRPGCIEIHTRAGNWRDHGHHRDPAYNQVVLHVAVEPDPCGKTLLQNGETVPTVILKQPAAPELESAARHKGLPCRGLGGRWSREQIAAVLDRAGNARLEEKAERYRNSLMDTSPDQCLYQGLLEAMGYIRNKTPFLRLAGLAPLKSMERLFGRYSEKDISTIIQAFLLGTAGLLPSQRRLAISGDRYTASLEQVWSVMPHQRTLSCREWELYKVRPANHPVRRIAAISQLLRRYLDSGWLTAFSEALRQTSPDRPQKYLESLLMVRDGGYWADFSDFGRPLPNSPVLLGRDRAAIIVINIILPFFLSWSRMTEDPALFLKVREIYCLYPPLESNSIERHMLQQLSAESFRLESASKQQGLLHIYKKLCTQGKCGECIFSG